MLNYRSYGDLSRDISANVQKLPEFDLVVGIPKSGLIPGIMIASFANKRFLDLDSFQFGYSLRSGVRKYTTGPTEKLRVLVVDDTVNTGAEFTRTRRRLEHLSSEFQFIYCAVYGIAPELHNSVADVVMSYVQHPRIFQWNYRNHGVAEHALFDMDGVLCADPTDDENDDGDRYVDFLANARPLTLPTKVISGIVTSRLERYRSHTEQWLERAGVRYKDLLMIDLPTAAERRRLRAHAPFKASIYKSRDEILFIESNWKQALQIAAEADKPVICTENDIFIRDRDAALELQKKQPSQIVSREVELERQVSRLIDRLVETDPFAANWLKNSRYKYDPSKFSELSPFLKSRIVIGSMNHRTEKKSVAPKARDRRRILLISRTLDIRKGAGAAASSQRLKSALQAEGVDVYSLTLEDFPESHEATHDQPLGGVHLGYWGNYANAAHSRRILSRINEIDPDCIVLGAIDHGILSPLDIARIPYPIVWIARDNWLHTGGCLFKLEPQAVTKSVNTNAEFVEALLCEGYKTGCHHCPAMKDLSESLKSRINFELKKAAFEHRRDIVLAPISDWMANMLKMAPITNAHTIRTICNPIDLQTVRRLESRPDGIRQRFGLGEKEKIVLLAAHSVTNPRKGVGAFLKALFDRGPMDDVVFVYMGGGKLDVDVPEGHRIFPLGFIYDESEKISIYNEVDATLVPALQESLSVVASDSLCCGTPVVAYRTSGLANLVTHHETGYLADPFDPADLVAGLDWILIETQTRDLSDACIASATKLFDSTINVKALLDAADLAVQQFAGLGSYPKEIDALASALELIDEDFRYRAARFRHTDRRRRRLEAILDDNNGIKKLEEEYRHTTQEYENLKKVHAKLYEEYQRMSSEMARTRDKLEWNRKIRNELEQKLKKAISKPKSFTIFGGGA